MQLDRVRALVSGASGGIGGALIRQLVAGGASVLLAARDPLALAELSPPVADACLDTFAGDLTLADAREALAEVAAGHRVNVLVNLMGINELSLLADQPSERVETMIDTNLTAPVLLTRQLLPVLRDNAPAQVVNIGSAYGSIGHPGYAAYCAAKFGLRGFSEALRRELADTDIDVLYVAPRATDTAMNGDDARALNAALGNKEDSPAWVAERIVNAMRRGRKRTYLGWPEKLFVRVNDVFPRLVDNVLARQLETIKNHIRGTP